MLSFGARAISIDTRVSNSRFTVVKINERKEDARMKKDARERMRERMNGWKEGEQEKQNTHFCEEIIGEFVSLRSFRRSSLLGTDIFRGWKIALTPLRKIILYTKKTLVLHVSYVN